MRWEECTHSWDMSVRILGRAGVGSVMFDQDVLEVIASRKALG